WKLRPGTVGSRANRRILGQRGNGRKVPAAVGWGASGVPPGPLRSAPRRSRGAPLISDRLLCRVVVAVQEVPDAPGHLVLGIERVQGASPRQGIAGEEALVQDLPATERAARDVPGQAKELHAIAGGRGVGREVLLDVGAQGAPEVRLAGGDHEAAG